MDSSFVVHPSQYLLRRSILRRTDRIGGPDERRFYRASPAPPKRFAESSWPSGLNRKRIGHFWIIFWGKFLKKSDFRGYFSGDLWGQSLFLAQKWGQHVTTIDTVVKSFLNYAQKWAKNDQKVTKNDKKWMVFNKNEQKMRDFEQVF